MFLGTVPRPIFYEVRWGKDVSSCSSAGAVQLEPGVLASGGAGGVDPPACGATTRVDHARRGEASLSCAVRAVAPCFRVLKGCPSTPWMDEIHFAPV